MASVLSIAKQFPSCFLCRAMHSPRDDHLSFWCSCALIVRKRSDIREDSQSHRIGSCERESGGCQSGRNLERKEIVHLRGLRMCTQKPLCETRNVAFYLQRANL